MHRWARAIRDHLTGAAERQAILDYIEDFEQRVNARLSTIEQRVAASEQDQERDLDDQIREA